MFLKFRIDGFRINVDTSTNIISVEDGIGCQRFYSNPASLIHRVLFPHALDKEFVLFFVSPDCPQIIINIE